MIARFIPEKVYYRNFLCGAIAPWARPCGRSRSRLRPVRLGITDLDVVEKAVFAGDDQFNLGLGGVANACRLEKGGRLPVNRHTHRVADGFDDEHVPLAGFELGGERGAVGGEQLADFGFVLVDVFPQLDQSVALAAVAFVKESRLSRPLMLLTSTVQPAMQHPPHMTPPVISRRAFLKASSTLAAGAPFLGTALQGRSAEAKRPLVAYVGTFSSPLRDMLPTQVDLPPGNGRGIHLFQVNRTTGSMTPSGVYELGTSPSCLALNANGTRLYSANETDRVSDGNEGAVSAFAIHRADGHLKMLNGVRSGGAGPTYLSVHPSGRFLLVANYFGGSVAVLPILPDGILGAATDVKNDSGKLGPPRPP